MISIDDFKKVELKAGKILSAERVEGSEKLVKLSVDLGPSASPSVVSLSTLSSRPKGLGTNRSGQAKDIRQIIAGIGTVYTPETLVGKQIAVVANLEPRTFTLRPVRQAQGRPEELEGRHGSGQVVLESQGMLLAAEGEEGPVLLMPDSEVTPGAKIR